MRIRLLKPYHRDLELWVAYPIDPAIGSRWSEHAPGEILDVDVEEACPLIDADAAVEVGETDRAALLKTLAQLQTQPRSRWMTPRYGGTEYDDHNIAEAHRLADQALLGYINDEEIAAAYDAIPKWYS